MACMIAEAADVWAACCHANAMRCSWLLTWLDSHVKAVLAAKDVNAAYSLYAGLVIILC